MLLTALHDGHFIVRESAIDAIDDEGLTELLSAVRPLLEDAHPQSRGPMGADEYGERTRSAVDHDDQEAHDSGTDRDDPS